MKVGFCWVGVRGTGEPQRNLLNARRGHASLCLSGEVQLGGQEHFYMETQSMLVVPVGEEKEFNVYVSTQSPATTQVCMGASWSGCRHQAFPAETGSRHATPPSRLRANAGLFPDARR